MAETTEKLEARLAQVENKLLSLEESFTKNHDPETKKTIGELKGMVEALRAKLEKAKENDPPAPTAAAPVKAVELVAAVKKEKSFEQDLGLE